MSNPAIIQAIAIDGIETTLRGVDKATSLDFEGCYVSLGGGANLMVAATDGMYEAPEGNTVAFVTESLSPGLELTLQGTA